MGFDLFLVHNVQFCLVVEHVNPRVCGEAKFFNLGNSFRLHLSQVFERRIRCTGILKAGELAGLDIRLDGFFAAFRELNDDAELRLMLNPEASKDFSLIQCEVRVQLTHVTLQTQAAKGLIHGDSKVGCVALGVDDQRVRNVWRLGIQRTCLHCAAMGNNCRQQDCHGESKNQERVEEGKDFASHDATYFIAISNTLRITLGRVNKVIIIAILINNTYENFH